LNRLAGAVLVLGAVLVAAAPARVEAHAVLLTSDPPAGLVLDSPPAQVTLRFSEPATPVGSGIELIAPSGERVAGGSARAAGSTLSLPFHATAEGTYRVVWKVVSADTHPSRGTFTFSVGAPSPAPGGDGSGDVGLASPQGLFLQAVARWLGFAGLALLAGSLWTWLLLFPGEQRLRSLAGTGIVLAAAGAALSAWMLIGAAAESARWRANLLAPPIALALVEGASGHLLAGLPPVAAWVLNGIHVGAMAAWFGSLAAVLALRLPLSGLARPAAALAAVAILSGALLALLHLRSPGDLLLTAYGAVLALKIAATAVVLVLAGLAARRLELGALGAVVALAALLVSLPQPR